MVGFSLLILVVVYILFKYGEVKMVFFIIFMYVLAFYCIFSFVIGMINYYNEIVYN